MKRMRMKFVLLQLVQKGYIYLYTHEHPSFYCGMTAKGCELPYTPRVVVCELPSRLDNWMVVVVGGSLPRAQGEHIAGTFSMVDLVFKGVRDGVLKPKTDPRASAGPCIPAAFPHVKENHKKVWVGERGGFHGGYHGFRARWVLHGVLPMDWVCGSIFHSIQLLKKFVDTHFNLLSCPHFKCI